MPKYATNTSVAVEKSRAEIEKILKKYGASEFAYMTNATRAIIAFRAQDRLIRFELPLPSPDDRKFTHGAKYRWNPRPAAAAEKLWQQECRSRWRCLALVIKAKLEAVESEIAEFEQEFGMYVVLPGGKTVYEITRPQIAESYASGRPTLMLGPGSDS